MQTLGQLLHDSFINHAELSALDLPNERYSYKELQCLSRRIAAAMSYSGRPLPRAFGVFTSGDALAYAAFATALFSGVTYIPLSLTLPVRRLQRIIEETKLQTLLVSALSPSQLDLLLETVKLPLHIVYPEDVSEDISALIGKYPGHCFDQIPPEPKQNNAFTHGADEPAYLLYTSGSSGEPKPVAISQANLLSYHSSIVPVLGLQSSDRCAQANDLSFDLSIHDMLLTWSTGACLVPIPQRFRLTPARCIAEQGLTAWFSTPHIASTMFAASSIQDNAFPKLRLVLHAGEPFPLTLAKEWRRAAPQSRILNLYGPSETTIAIAAFEWQKDFSDFDSPFLPIGKIFPTHQYKLDARSGPEQNEENSGELCIAGPQVFTPPAPPPAEVAAAADPWYATGDLCRKLPSGNLLFLGRFDLTVKIRGFRVNLLELENVLREAVNNQNVSAIAWPPALLAADEIYAFVQTSSDFPEQEAIAKVRQQLPPYMVPTRIIAVAALPQTASGKVDRRALCDLVAALILARSKKSTPAPHKEA